MSNKSKHFLYLLVFKNESYFKIGITSNTFDRILKHDTTYNIDLNSSHLYSGNKKSINLLEQVLLNSFPQVINETYEGKDGYTEIRDLSVWDECIEIIEFYKKKFFIKKLEIKESVTNKVPLKTKPKYKRVEKNNVYSLNTLYKTVFENRKNFISVRKSNNNIYKIRFKENTVNSGCLNHFFSILSFEDSLSTSAIRVGFMNGVVKNDYVKELDFYLFTDAQDEKYIQGDQSLYVIHYSLCRLLNTLAKGEELKPYWYL